MVFFPVYQLKNKLQVLQNKMVRFNLKLGPRSHIGDEELKTVGMLKVEDRVRQLKLNHVFKIYNEVAPEYLNSHFTKLINIHRYNTRGSANNFLVPKIKGQQCNTFSIRVLGNGICYQLKLKPAKLTLNLKRQSKATFCPNYVLSFLFCRYLISKIELEDFFPPTLIICAIFVFYYYLCSFQ